MDFLSSSQITILRKMKSAPAKLKFELSDNKNMRIYQMFEFCFITDEIYARWEEYIYRKEKVEIKESDKIKIQILCSNRRINFFTFELKRSLTSSVNTNTLFYLFVCTFVQRLIFIFGLKSQSSYLSSEKNGKKIFKCAIKFHHRS
ncbi:hypothetical protein BpHYR1_024635 [Brachionus plicatilis]|uniref:Uncharacterized protein n=1 Tax=Brachionus plicatilis TaxID=10195 RepID=A0A3M7SGN9_BRAPC|nr:hypothetical protein BpHYR1_024635 [Brachionus plicatilis]